MSEVERSRYAIVISEWADPILRAYEKEHGKRLDHDQIEGDLLVNEEGDAQFELIIHSERLPSKL